VGILFFSSVARLAAAHLPPGLRGVDLLLVGVAAAIGFTVSLFFATAAFPPGAALDETTNGGALEFHRGSDCDWAVADLASIVEIRGHNRWSEPSQFWRWPPCWRL
jgi:hypothetical protein